jgi:hypothetical protein
MATVTNSMAAINFSASVLEITKAHFRESFLYAQPPLTRAMKSIFVSKFGSSDWLSKYQSYLKSSSMRAHAVDDGRDFDMCEFVFGSVL